MIVVVKPLPTWTVTQRVEQSVVGGIGLFWKMLVFLQVYLAQLQKMMANNHGQQAAANNFNNGGLPLVNPLGHLGSALGNLR